MILIFLGRSSSCDSWAEQDIDEVESKSSKKTARKKKGNKTRAKEKEQNFVKRNIEVNFRGIFTYNSSYLRCIRRCRKDFFPCNKLNG